MDLEHTALERICAASDMSLRLYQQPILFVYSGGKDSDLLIHLARKAGIPFEVQHSLTTADAPETVRHVKKVLSRLENAGVPCSIDKHVQPDGSRVTMWNLIPKKLMPPTRIARYCCQVLKEGGGKDRFIATGVRWDESVSRKKNRGHLEVITSRRENALILTSDNDENRRLFENCQMKGKRAVNPIVDWTTEQVWDYLESEHVELNPLYSCGFQRVGCIGCPMAGKHIRAAEFAMFPKIRNAYVRAFDRMLDERRARGKMSEGMRWGETGIDVYHWWMEDGIPPGQTSLPDDPPIDHLPTVLWGETHPKRQKKVRCIETGEVYRSGAEAARELNVSRSAVVDGIRRHAGYCGGYHWEFVDG